MDTAIRITSFTAHQTPEGMRVSATYSVIDAEGRLIKSNERFTRIVLDDDIAAAIDTVNSWLHAIVEGSQG